MRTLVTAAAATTSLALLLPAIATAETTPAPTQKSGPALVQPGATSEPTQAPSESPTAPTATAPAEPTPSDTSTPTTTPDTEAITPAPQETESSKSDRAEVTAAAAKSVIKQGKYVRLSGTADPSATVTVQARTTGSWLSIASVTADSAGIWSLKARPKQNTTYRSLATGSVSAQSTVTVIPAVDLTQKISAPTLLTSRIKATIGEGLYSGTIKVRITPDYGKATKLSIPVSGGKVSQKVKTMWVGRATVAVTIPATSQFAATTATWQAKGTVRKLFAGVRGPEVKALQRHLKTLNFRSPKLRNKFTHKTGDMVLAFRKSLSMKRSDNVNRNLWKALVVAKPIKPRYRRSGTYMEVDKTRQIMMVVRDGNVLGTIHVSTGRTGNTPEGHYRVFQRGGSYLYRFMAFKGNFGIHGYNPVPNTPASAGCVREPMWAADWTFNKTRYGASVYVYR